MKKDLSDITLSFVNLYEEFINYLIDNKKLSVSKADKGRQTKLGKYIREKNKSREKFKEFINYFEKIVRNRFPSEVLHNFDDNVEEFRIYGVCFQLSNLIKKLDQYNGKYNPKKNTMIIDITNNDSVLSIFHELFHMASTNRMIVDYVQTGFFSYKDGMGIGKGLNEGYTDLLAQRYFGDVGTKIGYPLEYRYSLALETIVDREKMENLYMSSNSYQLVRELEKYDSADNIICFLKMLDTINYPNDYYVSRASKFSTITRFLITWYARKLVLQGKNILDVETQKEIYAYAWQLPEKIVNLNLKGSFKVNINWITEGVIEELVNQYSNTNKRF